MTRAGGRTALAALFIIAWARAASALEPEATQFYGLQAELDPARHEVRGRALIRWRNTSRIAVHDLLFHLYPNAFASSRTVFMREGGTSIRGGALKRRGGLDVTALALADGTDLLAGADTALIPDDATQMRVPLPHPIAPSGQVELHVEFRVRLPSLLARMGAAGDFFMVAQWFPKLARLEPDGRWAGFPYHGLGEFYADFADYELVVVAPEDFVIAAPGRLTQSTRLHGGMRRERYVLRNALDVAFAAHPHLHRETLHAGRVRIDVFAPPGHIGLSRRQAALLRDGLASFGKRLGPYPHDRLVLVLPPHAAHGAAGMEYPGLITGWTASWRARVNPASEPMHDVVTAHELAHQWFPMLIATHEAEQPVLDEGLAEWLALDLVRHRYGRNSPWSLLLGVPIDPFELTRIAFATAQSPPSSLLPAYRYKPGDLAPSVYLRPALVFESIARSWGRERLWSVLGRYARGHRFRHATLHDLSKAFDAGYWPGFSSQVLHPALEGDSTGTQLEPIRRGASIERAAVPTAARPRPPLLSRVLLWAQALLGVLGP